MQNLWQSCLKLLEKELPAQQFNTWIRPLAPSDEAPGELRLVAPNRFVLQWVKDRFLGRIETMLADQAGHAMRVVLALPAAGEEPDAPAPSPRPRPAPAAPRAQPERKSAERSTMSAEFTFDNFVQGKANQLARAAAVQVAENPGASYNPLFVYGGSGLGKT
ncbi:MAG: DnaA N-terminal domain-containing protein, partial [Bacteroidota bacterium]